MKTTWYQLPEEDCERLNRPEMQALRWVIAALNSVALAEKDLQKRLECVPEGQVSYRLMLGQLRALCNDMIGTIPVKQCKQIKNVMDDMELRMIPKYTTNKNQVVMGVDDVSYIVSHAQRDEELCQTCIMDGNECRSCKMYQILESVAPLEDYGSGMMCPYNGDWFEK